MKLLVLSLLLTIIFTTIATTFIVNRVFKHMQTQMDYMSHLVYKMTSMLEDLEIHTMDIDHDFKTTYRHINDLTNNIAGYLKQEHTRRESSFIMPKPDLAQTIEATIKEQILIEANLSKNSRIPNGDLVYRIIQNVEKTYPDVDKEYLSKKTLVKIEEFNETAQNR